MTVPIARTGIVLAAGAGIRMGRPKALLRLPDGEPWVARATSVLRAAGCERVVVVLGAEADAARELVPADAAVAVVIARDWAEGMARSLRAGLAAATGVAALVTLVDLPGLPVGAALRIGAAPVTAGSLRRATYGGRPGHPVLLGRSHWPALAAELAGQADGELEAGARGARRYLAEHRVDEIECGDLWDGRDLDRLHPQVRDPA